MLIISHIYLIDQKEGDRSEKTFVAAAAVGGQLVPCHVHI